MSCSRLSHDSVGRCAGMIQSAEQIRSRFLIIVWQAERQRGSGARLRRLVRLISAGQFMIRFAVPPEAAAAIRKGAGVVVSLDSLPPSLSGRVSQVAPRIDTASQMIFVEADLEVPPGILERLQDGLPGRVSLRAGAAPPPGA